MRFWVMGCAAIVAAAGCSDSGGSSAGGATVSPPLTALKIEDVKVGKGPAAQSGDTMIVEYTGKLADGTVFDATSKHDDAPLAVVVGTHQVIAGWDQGLLGMKEGGDRKLSIPAALAYGDHPKPGSPIGPGADLFFEIKLDKLIAAADADSDTIEFISHGTGPKAKVGDTVKVKYIGKFANGKVFDPGNTPLDVVIGQGQFVQGFESALQGRQKGDHFVVTIPPKWGYGPQGKGPVPANSWLVFDMQILSVTPK